MLTTLVAGELHGQAFQDAKFGMIPDSLSEISSKEKYTGEPYVITNKEVDISFDDNGGSIVSVMDYHIRMKVLQDSVPEVALITIPYYFDDGLEQVSDIRGLTHLPSGKRIAMDEKQIRTVNLNSRYNVKEFRMPTVTKGAVVEYRYTIQRRYIEELPPFYMSHQVPTLATKLTITYPQYLRYGSFVDNYDGHIANDFVYTDTSSVPKIFTIPQPAPITTERWMAYDIKPTREAPFITTLDDYRAKMKFLMNEFGIPRQSLETSWDVVVAKMRRKTNPLAQIRKNDFANKIGDSLRAQYASLGREAIQDSIFRYLNTRVNFSGAHTPYSTDSDSLVLKGEPSDQAAINQTLIAMLRGAGIQADPVLLSSRKSGQIDKDIPIFYQFNSQFARTAINGETYLLDASFSHSEPDLIPVDMFNGPGLLLQENDYQWIAINPDKSKFAINVDIDAELSSEGILSGTFTARESGYPKQQFRLQKGNGASNKQIVERTLFDGYSSLQLDGIRVENMETYGTPLRISGSFEIEDYAVSFSDGVEYRPMVVGSRQQNPFEDEFRTLPVTLNAPEKLNLSYTVTLPEGYSIEQGRGNNRIAFEGATFEESYNLTGREMNYDYYIDISDHKFSTDIFPRLYDLYSRWAKLSKARWLIKNQN